MIVLIYEKKILNFVCIRQNILHLMNQLFWGSLLRGGNVPPDLQCGKTQTINILKRIYDRNESFHFDYEPNRIPFGL